MAPVVPLRPMADGTLIEFFLNEAAMLTGKRLRRVEAAHTDLLACFAAHLLSIVPGALPLPTDSRPDAAARLVPPAAILLVLPHFLDEPRWQGDDLQDRIVRSRLAWSLAQWVAWPLDLQGSEPYEAVRDAVRRSRTGVRRVKAEVARRHLEESGLWTPEFEAVLTRIQASRAAASSSTTAR